MDSKITSEDIKKALKRLEETEEYNYNSPIEIYQTIEKINRDIREKNEKEIMYQINQHVDVNKEELIRALNYDRNQYYTGYQKGFDNAEKLYLKVIELMAKEFGYSDEQEIEKLIQMYLKEAREE